MKYVPFLLVCLLVGCASTTGIEKQSYVSKLDFNIPAGQYDWYQVSTWDKGDSECIALSLSKPYNTTKWVASVMLFMAGKSDKELTKVSLFTEYTKSKTLSLAFVNGKNEQIFKSNIKFGEDVKLKATFPNDHTIRVKVGKSEFSFPVGYPIQRLLVGASSARATVKFLHDQSCDSASMEKTSGA